MKLKFGLKTLAVLIAVCALCIAWRTDRSQLAAQVQTLQFGQHVDALSADLARHNNKYKRARTAARIGIIAKEDHALFGSPEVIIGYAPPLISALSDSECAVALEAQTSLVIIATRMGSPGPGGGFVFPVPVDVVESWKKWHETNSR
jgi:hypothetical protein